MRTIFSWQLLCAGLVLMALGMLLYTVAVAAPPKAVARVQRFAALPDWSGIWETELSAAMASDEIDQRIARAAAQPNRPEFNFAPPGALQPFEVEFFRLVQLLQKPPYNAAWNRRYLEQVARLKQTPAGAVDPGTVRSCVWGFPLLMESPTDGVFQLFVTPEETLFLFANGEVRHIYTDQRRHPRKEDLWPTTMGNSIGRWEGHTLVVDTIERSAGPVIPIPHFISPDFSEQAHFVERVRRDARDTLEDDLTIDDPTRFAHPWHLLLHFRRVTNLDRLIPTNCTENDRNPVVAGKVIIAPR